MTVTQLKERARELGVDDDERMTRSNGHRPVKDDWLATLRRIADALATIARELRALNVREEREGASEEEPR